MARRNRSTDYIKSIRPGRPARPVAMMAPHQAPVERPEAAHADRGVVSRLSAENARLQSLLLDMQRTFIGKGYSRIVDDLREKHGFPRYH